MWDLAVREKDFQAADSMLTRYRGSVPLSFRLVPARGRGDAQAVSALLDEARTLESRQLQLAARYTAAYLDDVEFGDSLARLRSRLANATGESRPGTGPARMDGRRAWKMVGCTTPV